jgi:hypothetical protein
MSDLFEKNLNRWFKEKWVDVSRKDKDGKHPPCGRSKAKKGSKGYPKCRPSVKVSGKTPKTSGSMSDGEKRAATKRKRSKKQGVGGKPTVVKSTDVALDAAWSSLTKGLESRRLKPYLPHMAHPSISDERLQEQQWNPKAQIQVSPVYDDKEHGYDRGSGEKTSLAEEYQATNRSPVRNTSLTRFKQLPQRHAKGRALDRAIERNIETHNRHLATGRKPLPSMAPTMAPLGPPTQFVDEDYLRNERNLRDQYAREMNTMSWADANRANEQAQAEMKAGTLQMQPVPQPPETGQIMAGEPMDIAWSSLTKAKKKKSKPFHGYNPKKHHRKGGLNAKGRAKAKREEGANLKPPVTTKPSKLKAGSKKAKRRKSFCARMTGVKGPTSKKGKLTPKGAALKRWNC